MTDKAKKDFLSEEQRAISNKLQESMRFDPETKTVISNSGKDDLFEKTLPESLPIEQVNAVSKHLKNFNIGITHAFGTHTGPAFEKHKDLESVGMSVAMGSSDKLEVKAERKFVSYSSTDRTKEYETYNKVTTKFEMHYSKIGSTIKAVREEANALVMEALSK